jgi:hypothetical protein
MWTDDIDPNQYAEFLIKVFRRITCKKFIRRTGIIEK